MTHGTMCKVVGLVVCGTIAPGCDELALPGGSGGAGGDSLGEGGDQTIMQEDLDQEYDEQGGVKCSTPDDCVKKCVAEAKYCWAAHATHPHKPPMVGDLYQCIDRVPKAKYGGSYTCLYAFPNGDVCIFAYGSKLGPIHLPAPPPLCVYKS